MITMHGEHASLPPLPRWLAARSAIYLVIALFSGQAFIGFSGLGRGGEWIIAALACEMFCALWAIRHYPGLSLKPLRALAAEENPRKLKIVAAGPDIMNVSLVEVSVAESGLLGRLLSGISGTGTSFIVQDTSKEVLAVLLSREEYELLTAAAIIVRDPERWEELMHQPVDRGTSVEDAFRDK